LKQEEQIDKNIFTKEEEEEEEEKFCLKLFCFLFCFEFFLNSKVEHNSK